MRVVIRKLACAVALVVTASTVIAATPHVQSPGALAPVKIQDLYYGDVLFYFYQEDYFSALTRLSAAQLKNRLPHHADDADLLLGGLYLSVGQHREAGQIFSEVLNRKNVPAAVRDRARFFLGKVWYQRGYFEKAAATLAETGKAGLTPEMDAERHMLLAQTFMFLGKYPEAIQSLENWKGPPTWQAYAQFNLGVALVRSGRLDEGTRLLNQVGLLQRSSRELDALQDKANLAHGYALLQANRPTEARAVLERVRLQGPLSTKALLGVGWAESALGDYKEALAPWLELHGRNLLDSAVQESYLAVPYAYAKLNANRQAADAYESAIKEFAAETTRLNESITAIRGGGLIDTIVKNESKSQLGWFWQLSALPDAPESRYLFHLLAHNEFQEGLKNYRMMRYMERNLDGWAASVDAFGDMLATRRERYSGKLPEVLTRLRGVDVEELQRRRTEFESRIATAEATGDRATLGTPREREIWAQVEQMESVLASAGNDADLDDAREKVRLIKGVTYWQMDDGFKARAWAARKNLREVAQALRETEKRWSLVQEAKTAVPDRNGEFGERITMLGPRIEATRDRLTTLEGAQARYLADIAIGELESQKERIGTYMLQARYSLATIYDRAADEQQKGAVPVAPGTPPDQHK